MPKKRTKQQKIKAQQRQPERIAMIQSQYQFNAPSLGSSNTATPVKSGVLSRGHLKSSDLFRYDTQLIYRDIIKTLVITVTMVIALVIISRFAR
jgi:hypothetical protein